MRESSEADDPETDQVRTEYDTMGPVRVPANALYGAQTQRAIHHFVVGANHSLMPIAIVHAIALIKSAAATTNEEVGKLDARRARAIESAARAVHTGEHDDAFPLPVYISGSGTQSNMNVNEVIAKLANATLLAQPSEPHDAAAPELKVHPNDHVNASQSTNDVFPSAIHVAAAIKLSGELDPLLEVVIELLHKRAETYKNVFKVGRTHLMDAVPMTFGQEVGGWAATLAQARDSLREATDELLFIPVGGTAVGTGINCPAGFDSGVCKQLKKLTGLPFRPTANKFASMAGHEAMLRAMGALKLLAVALLRISNDVRMGGSGPRCGLGELILPANEPGSSIMPGKVNPTQCEALAQRAAQVIGHEVAATVGCSGGFQQMNVYKPLIGQCILESIRLLVDGISLFQTYCLEGLCPDEGAMLKHLQRSLMLVTALNPKIGYDNAAAIAKHAHANGTTLREAALHLGHLTAEEFDQAIDYEAMVRPHK